MASLSFTRLCARTASFTVGCYPPSSPGSRCSRSPREPNWTNGSPHASPMPVRRTVLPKVAAMFQLMVLTATKSSESLCRMGRFSVCRHSDPRPVHGSTSTNHDRIFRRVAPLDQCSGASSLCAVTQRGSLRAAPNTREESFDMNLLRNTGRGDSRTRPIHRDSMVT